MTIKETDQTAEETDQTASMPEPGSTARPAPERVPYPMPPTDSDATLAAEIETDSETDAEVASDVDADVDDIDTRADPFDRSGSQDLADDETGTDAEPTLATDEVESDDDADLATDLEADMQGEDELDGDRQAEPDLEPAADEGSGAVLVAGKAASSGVTDVPDLDNEVDLRVPPVEVASEATPLLGDAGVYEERWTTIQTAFVDEPRHAVHNADALVTEAMEDLARTIVSHRDSLQSQWRQDPDVDTERLRLIFREYRTFLHGLLTA